MKLIFVDTSGWIGLVVVSDSRHQETTQIYQSKYSEDCHFVTHQGVMLEVGNSCSSLRLRSAAIGLKNKLAKSNRVRIVELDDNLYEAGWKLYAGRSDKDWGIVDCISFIVMQKYGISEALTTDRHFQQAGFIKLL